MLAGVKSTFKGQVVGEEYTVWPSQLDFSAELTKAKNSGPSRSSCSIRALPACSSSISTPRPDSRADPALAFTIDELSLPLQKENAIGVPGAQQWVNDSRSREQEVRRGLRK